MTKATIDASIQVVVLPGWLNSEPAHWQSHWIKQHGAMRIEQHDWVSPLRGDWVAAFESQLSDCRDMAESRGEAPPRFAVAAHSLGCHLLAAWLAHSPNAGWVTAALLVAPPDLSRPDLPPAVARWAPAIKQPIPAPLRAAAVMVGSDNDPFSSWSATQALATQWGVESILMSGAGHINVASGLGDWPSGWQQLQQLIHQESIAHGN